MLCFVCSLDARSCKDEIYRMGIGAGYCEGNLNFATASEDDEVYTKKKVSRVSRFVFSLYYSPCRRFCFLRKIRKKLKETKRLC